MTEPANPYRDGVCWYGLKVPMRDNHQRGTVVPCGLDARKYTVPTPQHRRYYIYSNVGVGLPQPQNQSGT